MTGTFSSIVQGVIDFFKSDGVQVLPEGARRVDPWSAYRGQFPAVLKPSRTDPNAEDNIRLPLIGQIVDTSVSYLVGGGEAGQGVTLDIDGADDGPAQKILDEFCARSHWQVMVQKAALNGAVRGHAFLKLIVTDGKPDRAQVIPSDRVTVTTDPRDCDTATGYTMVWAGPTTANRNPDKFMEEITRAEDGGSWMIVESIDRGGRGSWVMQGDPVIWPYPWAPIFDCQNLTQVGDYWGRPDATGAMVAQNLSINMLLSMGSRLLRNHSNPKVTLTGMKNSKIEWMTDGALTLPDGAKADQLSMDAGGAGALLELYKELREALHTTSRTPEVASGKLDGAGGISGVALSILYGPLDAKTGEKRLHYGPMLESLALRVLELSGITSRTVSVVWPDTTPRNLLEQRQSALIDQQLGIVSKETLSKNLGYDWDTESEQMADEAETDGEKTLRNADRGLDGKGNPIPPEAM